MTAAEHAPSADSATPECPRCGRVDDPSIPAVHLCSGMRPVPESERIEFSPEDREQLLATLDEYERVRNRGAVEARSAWIG